jgi:ABC-type transport system involved in multi-copper enzyme maturation permease subunit
MKAIHNILTVSKYESKTLFRSWFFRIFSILSLLFVFLFNMGTQTSIGWPSNGDMVALPSMVPFINLYIINIAQAIIAVFLASDFLKRDKKLDTTEVIYMRSMTNADYVIGKTIGNVWVFFALNFVALAMVAVFNLTSPYTQFSLAPYFYYFLLISFPTLIFILGFSFFLMSVIKNQAVTFVILLGYIAATLFYLQNIYHYLFDYMAFHLPMTYSDFVGFGFLKDILIHRGIYLFLGLGFIGLTILLLQRLSQSPVVRKITLVFSIGFLSLGLGLGFTYIHNIDSNDSYRAQMLELNNKYAKSPIVEVKKCDLILEHKGDEISGEAELTLGNQNNEPLSDFVLTLNPGLEITAVSGAQFSREQQILKIRPDAPLQKGGELKIKISYKGTIDESFCYLDMNRERLELWLQRGNGIADKKHAFITPDYLLLTPETRWYPTAGISYSSEGLQWQTTQFSDFHLKVKTFNGLKAISQGKMVDEGNGSFDFSPETRLPQLSLAVGKYLTRSIVVDSLTYNLNFMAGHNNFDPYFKVLKDSLKPVIRDLRKTWEAKVRFSYPYQRLNLVEIPVQFCSFGHVWSGAGEQVQPETVYLPEGGFKLASANFPLQKKMTERWSGHDNQTISPRENEENYFKRFVNEVLLSSKTSPQRMMGGGPGMRIGGQAPTQEEINPYFIFPNYYTFVSYIKSDKYPIANRAIESYLSKAATETGNPFMRNMMGLSDTEKGNIALQDASFSAILDKQDDPDVVSNVILTKSGFLFALMKGAVGPDKFDEFIYKFIEGRRFHSYSIEDLNEQLKSSFSMDLNQYLPSWYNSKTLPGYIVSKITTMKLKKDDQIKTMVSFIITNTENDPGAVSVTFRMGGGGRGGFRMRGGGGGGADDNIEKTVLINGKVSKKITYLFNREPRSMSVNTYASHNIPSSISQQFGKIEIDEKLQAENAEEVVAYTEGVEPNEIILDNEDPGFMVSKPRTNSLIQRIFKPVDNEAEKKGLGKNKELKYKGLTFWNPPAEWTLSTNEQFYGKQIRSAYYLKGGNGDRKATWNIAIKAPGYYKVLAYIPKIRAGWGHDERVDEEYNFTIFHDDGQDHQIVNMKDNDTGWLEIGSYHLSPDTVKIELSNLTKAASIYADAIKLVKEN